MILKRFVHIVALLVPLLAGCGRNQEFLLPGRTITFRLPFEPARVPMGYCDTGRRGGYFYFANFRTARQVVFCDTGGKVIASADLHAWIQQDDPWYYLQVRSMDSMAAFSSERNELFVFGRRQLYGSVQRPHIKCDSGSMILYGGPQPPDGGFPYTYSIIEPDRADFTDTAGSVDWQAFYRSCNKRPVFVRISGLFSGTPEYVPQGADLQRRFMPPDVPGELPAYASSGRYLYCIFPNSDTLYQLDQKDGRLIQCAQLHSRYTQPGVAMPPADVLNDAERNQAYTDHVQNCEAIVRNMKYDRYRHLLYLPCYHRVAADAPGTEKGDHRAWSLFIYNESLQQEAEVLFRKETYDPRSILIRPEGILIRSVAVTGNRQSARSLRFQYFTFRTKAS